MCAMLMHVPMLAAFLCADIASLHTGVELGMDELAVRLRLTCDHSQGGRANIRTVEICTNTAPQVAHARFGKTGIGAAGARRDTFA